MKNSSSLYGICRTDSTVKTCGKAFGETLEKRAQWENAGTLEFTNRFDDFATLIGFLFGFWVTSFIQKLTGTEDAWWITYPKYVITAFGALISLSNLLNNLQSKSNLVHLARKRLSSLVTMNNTLKQLNVLQESNHDASVSFLDHTTHYTDHKSKSTQRFLRLLSSSSFHVGNGYWDSFFGSVLHAIPTFLQIKNDFCPLLYVLAEIDAYVSIAKLYKEHRATKHSYTFSNYLDTVKGPQLVLSDFWHPMLSPEKAVASSLHLGTIHGKRNIVITGPNTAGKSTLCKAMMLSALLAQTITIAPGTEQKITPFALLNTYLNIVDSVDASQHRSEVRRALNMIQEIQALPRDTFALGIMDEMFRVTDPATGAAAALNWISTWNL